MQAEGEAGILHFLRGGGATGAVMRAHDWTSSALGPPETWTQPLRTLVGVMLGSHQPMFVAWGPQRSLLYNDGYAVILGARHPRALGRPFFEVWAELRDPLIPLVERAFAGEAIHMDDIALTIWRNGYPEKSHFAFSYTPVPNEAGDVVGMFCACQETTDRVQAEASLRESEARWRGLFERMSEGFFLAEVLRDASGRVNDLRFLDVNPAFERLTGLTAAHSQGPPIGRSPRTLPRYLALSRYGSR